MHHDPIRVTASEFQKAFGAISDRALKTPVTITKQGRDHLVVMAADEYQRLKRRDRIVYSIEELPQEWIEALRNAKMDSRHDHLNALLDK
ncbi:MAG: type II toxin-antitoxin system Phd/YefM family antitoxin [Acidobacteriia bacterium]|nr:type II toxin-antitoxin system Phd/YefM family antitoxin [Terriglobia bacterium]